MWQIVLVAGFKEVVQVAIGTLIFFFFPNKPGLLRLMRIIVMLPIIDKEKEEMFFS